LKKHGLLAALLFQAMQIRMKTQEALDAGLLGDVFWGEGGQ